MEKDAFASSAASLQVAMMNKKADIEIDRLAVGITGITGGLGRRLSEKLTSSGCSIRALVRKASNREGLPKEIKYVFGDIRDPLSLARFVQDLDVCIHLAAQVSSAPKKELYEINIQGTENVCRAILKNNPRCRLLYCSTISTLKVRPLCEFLSSEYAISKYYAEKKVVKYMKNDGLGATIIYPGIIYGGYDRSFMPQIIDALRKEKIRLIRGGEHNAPLIHVDELCDLFIKSSWDRRSLGKRYVSVKGIEFGIHEILKLIAMKLNCKVPEKKYPKWPLFIFALLTELFYKVFKDGNKPPLNRTAVDILSINFRDYKKKFDDPKADLGWEQDTSKEFFLKRLGEMIT